MNIKRLRHACTSIIACVSVYAGIQCKAASKATELPQTASPTVSPAQAAETPATETQPAISAEIGNTMPQTVSDRLLAGARAGDGPMIQKVIEESFKGPRIDQQGATELLNSLVTSREVKPFKLLLAELRQTNLGKDWQPDDVSLASLVKEGRTDFLDALLAERLDLKRLQGQQNIADAATSAWIIRRVAETQRERDDMKKLVEACAKGDADPVRQLLDSGVNVNGRMSDGSSWTPLTRAAASSKADVVKLLLERGAQPDLPKFPGWDYTPLCLTSSVEVANLLKAGGANVHASLFRRNTSILTYVAMFGGAQMVQWFLDQGLDPKMIGDNDETLLFGVKDPATVEILLKAGVDPNRPNEFGNVPLQEARSGAVAEALIKGGAKLTGLKKPLLPGMMQFASADAIEAVLKASGPQDPSVLQNALIGAAHMDNDKTAQVLLNHGAKPNVPGEWSGPKNKLLPLQVCCIFGSVKTAKVLIAHGADPNAGDMPGQMLKTAVHNRYKDLAEILKNAGAKGVSDLTYSIATGDKKRTAELLSSAPAYVDKPAFWDGALSAAAERGDLETVRAAIQKGVPVIVKAPKARMSDGYSSAAFEGQWEVLAFLLGLRGAKSDPHELDQALWDAVWNSHPYPEQRPTADFEKCVQILLAAGAPVKTSKAKFADSGLVTTAVFSRFPGGNPQVIEMLVAAGADPNPEVGKGKHLTDIITESCKQNGCSVPNEQVITTLEKLGKVSINRGI